MWVIGGQCGLTPEQVLDMTLTMLRAYVEGYQERLFDRQCLAVHYGYWSGYYQTKKPKSMKTVLTQMIKHHEKVKLKKHSEKNKDNQAITVTTQVDVDAFVAQERKFKARLKKVSDK